MKIIVQKKKKKIVIIKNNIAIQHKFNHNNAQLAK